jgi:hypothetical protein
LSCTRVPSLEALRAAGTVRRKVVPLRPQRCRPKPKMPDADLLAAIRADLETSLFSGEGHRKVWARLRILRGIRVSRARVLRVMREYALLSPYRRPHWRCETLGFMSPDGARPVYAMCKAA